MSSTARPASSDPLSKDLDKTIVAAKKQIESAYATALARYAKLGAMKTDSPQYRRIDAEIQAQYRQAVSEAIERLENEIRYRAASDFALATRDLPSRRENQGDFAERFRQSKTLAARTEQQIRHSAARLSREAELFSRLLADSPEPLGEIRRGKLSAGQMKRLSALMKDPLAVRRAAGIDMAQWRKGVYGTDTPTDAAALLGQAVERELVKDHYLLQNTLGREVPEILGYRISVRPTTRRGTPRKTDICDRYAGDYSPDFVFTGWHYNCRCRCQPIIPAALLTAELRAKGFVGIPGNARIERMPAGVSGSLTAARQQYERDFPELAEANFVEYRGQKRLLADLSREEQLEYYLNRFKGDFLQDIREIRVSLTAPADPEVLMDTRTEGERIHFQLSTLQARDGHIPSDDLLGAFKKSGTGLALNRAQISAVSDITHEMVHTLSRDYSFAQMEQMYPQWRDELLEFHLNPSSYQRLSLETLTEWYSREILPQVARQQGWSLPDGYRTHIETGYTAQVKNLETFLRYVPDPEQFRRELSAILRRRDKAMAYRFLAQAIRESKTLRSARSAETALKKMLDTSQSEMFQQYMDKNARLPASTTPAETAPAGGVIGTLREGEKVTQAMKKAGAATSGKKAAETVKKLGSQLDLHRDAMIPIRTASLARAIRHVRWPATLLAPIGIADQVYNQSQQPSEASQDGLPARSHYLHPDTYRGRGYTAAVGAGVADAAIELIAWPIKTILGVGEYAYRGMAKGLSLQPMPEGAFKTKLQQIGAKFDATNQLSTDFILESAEFFYLYQTDKDFRRMFELQMSLDVYQYYQAVKGTNEAQGYEQGRMIGDIITLLISAGGLKKLIQQWKRLRTISPLENYLPNMHIPPMPKPSRLLPATTGGTKRLNDGSAAAVSTHATKALPASKQPRLLPATTGGVKRLNDGSAAAVSAHATKALPASKQPRLLPAATGGTKRLNNGSAAAVSAHKTKSLADAIVGPKPLKAATLVKAKAALPVTKTPSSVTKTPSAEEQKDYERYLKRKEKQHKTPRDFDDWKYMSDSMRYRSPLARGIRFDQKAENEKWYPYNQVYLANGKRLDSYNPNTGQIVSRKSIDLSKITTWQFKRYLKEFNDKYSPGMVIRSRKHSFIYGQVLKGKYYLEIPDYNKNSPKLEKFIKLARKYNVEIIFKPE